MVDEAVTLTICLPAQRRRLRTRNSILRAVLKCLEDRTGIRLEAYRIEAQDATYVVPKGTLEAWEERASYGAGA